MRLHALTMSAFGPFAGTERVDFDALSTGGLFLFTGATGAGKTSVLDAVCFALYGQVPGARQQARSLRSDHAAVSARPQVVLEVTVRGRRLRITRSPQWERPKRRGTGIMVEQARVLVEECDGAATWRTRSTRLDEAGQLLGSLLGLSLAQFCQVVLLPQGQFAEFLRADADKRRRLLESLFDTGRFAAVEGWLVGQRQAAARELDALDRRIAETVARVAEAGVAEPPEELLPSEAAGWVDQLLDEALAMAQTSASAGRGAVAVASAAGAAVSAAQQVGALQQRRAGLHDRLQAVQAAQGERDAAVRELEAARAVAPLLPLLAEVGRLQVELEAARVLAEGRHAQVHPALAETGTGPGSAVLPAALVVVGATRRTREEAGSLGHLVEREQEIDEMTLAIDALLQQAVEVTACSEEAADWLAGSQDRRAALVAARDDARAARSGLADAEAARGRAAVRVEAATERDALQRQVYDARDVLRVLTDSHQQARDELLILRETRLEGMAAELAAGLLPGEDCPVCGSATHPLPASPVGAVVTREQEDAAGRRAGAAEAARHDAGSTLSTLQVELARQRSTAGGDAPVSSLRAELDMAAAVAADLRVRTTTLPGAEAALAAFDQDRETWIRQRVALDEEARGIADRVAEQRQSVARLLHAVVLARGDDPSVAARANRLQILADDLDGLAAQLGDVERLYAAVAAAWSRAEQAVLERAEVDQAVASIDDVALAARDGDRIAELEDLRQWHDSERRTVDEQLEDPDLVAAAAVPMPDIAALLTRAEQAARARDDAVAISAAAAERVSALQRLLAGLTRLVAERAPVAIRHGLVDHLSRLAEGKSVDNRLRMSLSAYVLAARLEQVAASASHRLRRMSSGRYSLLHTADGGTGRARGGLALKVLDAWTGQERDPSTLSGGESFAASLALALGLADVVTAESGGALLETLFVDEGFGSLDDDTLDEVMAVLDDLRDGGRAVGIVSHVADLRQRIPVQLRIEKGRHGSLVRQ